MNLFELAARHPMRVEGGVPDWMLGHFRRRTISFADGRSDERTQVHWLQSRTFTIDLRLPEGPPLPGRAWQDYDAAELRVLANHEGWVADSVWEGGMLSWRGGVSLQLHNRWPEPARLQRIGNCMIEFGTTGAYVEDWRLQAGGAVDRPAPVGRMRRRNRPGVASWGWPDRLRRAAWLGAGASAGAAVVEHAIA